MPFSTKKAVAYSRVDSRDPDASPSHSQFVDENIDELDPLRNPHHDIESDSEDDDWKNEKSQLRRPGRGQTPRESLAYGAPRRAISLSRLRRYVSTIFPAWALNKRLLYLALLCLGGFAVFVWFPRLFPRYELSAVNGESEPWYPTPKGGTNRLWLDAYKPAVDMVARMTLAEKVNITTGTGWMMGLCVGNTGPATLVGFPSLCLQDGPLGLRFADNVTAGPAGITVGATWNPDLMYKRGRMLGLEARSKGINVLLGPSVGPLGRIPAGGRNWESFGADPVLQGLAASMTVRGVQHEGVMATIKHFVGNEQEHYRQAWEWGLPAAISTNMDDRTLHEMYAWPFADAVREGVASVMCSYNQLNNSYACQNSKLINGILKDELGFQGFVQSDWLAQRSGVASALAGLDMSMPGDGEHWQDGIPFWGPQLTTAVLNGSVPIGRLNDMVTRIVAAWHLVGQDRWERPPPEGRGGPNFSSWTHDREGLIHPGSDDQTTDVVNQWVDASNAGDFSHSALSRRIAAEGTVLLKNEAQMLPLSRSGKPQAEEKEKYTNMGSRKVQVAVYGEDAVTPDGGPNTCPDRGCNRGTLAMGWGSGAVDFPYLVSPWQALQRDFRSLDVILQLWPTNNLPPSQSELRPEDQELCIVFANAAGGEGFLADGDIKGDRNDLRLQKGSEALIKDVASRCGKNTPSRKWMGNKRGNTIVVIHSIGPVIVESFIENSAIGAVLLANLPGQESGNALADVLFGRVNPSGRLPYTMGKSEDDYGPSAELIYRSKEAVPQQNFTEGILTDYRWFDAMDITPRFEFGHGLSYSEFKIDDLRVYIRDEQDPPSSLPPGRPPFDLDPPQYDETIPPVESAIFPSDWRRLKKYIYPYIGRAEDVVPDLDPDYKHFPVADPSPAGGSEGGHPALWDVVLDVEVDVMNIDHRSGQTVVQLYVAFPQEVKEAYGDGFDVTGLAEQKQTSHKINFPPRVLRGFDKVHLRGSVSSAPEGSIFPDKVESHEGEYDGLDADPFKALGEDRDLHHQHSHKSGVSEQNEKPDGERQARRPYERVHQQVAAPPERYSTGEKRTVTFHLTRRDLSYWSVKQQNWVFPSGTFGIEVGFSSRNLPLRADVF